MPIKCNRGGLALKTGKIGRVNIIRQQMMLPGETIKSKVSGNVRLEALRERDSVRIHARIDAFLTPIRWLWNQWPDYIKDGASGASGYTVPTLNTTNTVGLDQLGIGTNVGDVDYFSWFHAAPLRIYNEWYKWPESGDVPAWINDGWPATPLPTPYSTMRQSSNLPVLSEYGIQTSTIAEQANTFDIRDLATVQAKYRNRQERDYMALDRYQEILNDLWGEMGSREVDQVPIRLRGAEVGVNPKNIAATDAAGLGQFQALYDFNVDHDFGRITAPEHCVLTYVLVVRFATVAEDECNYMALIDDKEWEEIVGDPGILAAKPPVPVRRRDFCGYPEANNPIKGYLPAGWHWRSGWSMVNHEIDDRNSFPVYSSLNTLPLPLREAHRINDCFRSTALGDYISTLYFSESSSMPLPGPLASVYSGTGDAGRGSSGRDMRPGKVV